MSVHVSRKCDIMLSWNTGQREHHPSAFCVPCQIVVSVRGCRTSQPDRTGISGAGESSGWRGLGEDIEKEDSMEIVMRRCPN